LVEVFEFANVFCEKKKAEELEPPKVEYPQTETTFKFNLDSIKDNAWVKNYYISTGKKYSHRGGKESLGLLLHYIGRKLDIVPMMLWRVLSCVDAHLANQFGGIKEKADPRKKK
jgi:hypothetical protein